MHQVILRSSEVIKVKCVLLDATQKKKHEPPCDLLLKVAYNTYGMNSMRGITSHYFCRYIHWLFVQQYTHLLSHTYQSVHMWHLNNDMNRVLHQFNIITVTKQTSKFIIIKFVSSKDTHMEVGPHVFILPYFKKAMTFFFSLLILGPDSWKQKIYSILVWVMSTQLAGSNKHQLKSTQTPECPKIVQCRL